MFGTRCPFQQRPELHEAAPASAGSAARRQAWRGGYWALALLLALPAGTHSQIDPRRGPPNAKTDQIDPTLPMGGFGSAETERLLLMLNAARQKSVVSDTDKLLKLAQELARETSASKSSSLTQEQLRKVAKIERLARNVKQGMSNSILGAPGTHGDSPRYEP
jgi:hypothetical protein